MKQKNLLTRMLLLFALVVGSVTSVWAADEPKVTLDFTSNNNWQFPTKKVDDGTENSYKNGDYTIKLGGGTSGAGYGFNDTGYLIMGKSGCYMTLPAFSFNVKKIVVNGRSGASGSVKQNIFVGTTAVSTETTGATGSNTYEINSDYRDAGTIYVFKVTSNHNTQITSIEIYEDVPSSPLASISLSGTYPTEFYVGGTFSHAGAVVTATYADNSTEIVTEDATFSAPDMTTTGTKEVTVTYTEGGVTKTTSYNITVKARPALSSIALSGDCPTTFSQGATFNHDGLVVTATYADESTKNVTEAATFSDPDMTTLGTKTVTVSYTEGEVTKTVTYEITVTEYVQPINITISDWSALFGVASDAGDKVTKQDYLGEIDRVTVVYKQATYMYIKTSDLRIYNGSALTFTAPTGYYLTKVVFGGTSSSEKAPSADVGTFNYSTKTWTGFASSFTLSRNSGKDYTKFSSATITLVKVISTSIASSGYSTLSNDNDLDFANAVAGNETADALVAYIIPRNDGAKLTMSTVTEAPAGTGILLKGTPSVTYTIPVKTNAASVGTNLLKAGPVTVPEGNQTIYLLSGGQFHIAAAGTTSVGKAYLELPAAVGAPALSIDNDDETTGIGMTTVNGQQTTDGVYYDLSGRRVAQPTKGLYIVNGKKIVIK